MDEEEEDSGDDGTGDEGSDGDGGSDGTGDSFGEGATWGVDASTIGSTPSLGSFLEAHPWLIAPPDPQPVPATMPTTTDASDAMRISATILLDEIAAAIAAGGNSPNAMPGVSPAYLQYLTTLAAGEVDTSQSMTMSDSTWSGGQASAFQLAAFHPDATPPPGSIPYTFPDGTLPTTLYLQPGSTVQELDDDRVIIKQPDGRTSDYHWVDLPDGTRDYQVTTTQAQPAETLAERLAKLTVPIPSSPQPPNPSGVTVTPIGPPPPPPTWLPPELQAPPPSPPVPPSPPSPPSPPLPWTPPVVTNPPPTTNVPPGATDWVYNFPTTRVLPIPWELGSGERGIAAEPLITREFYWPYHVDVLPRGTPAIDVSIGGNKTPIDGVLNRLPYVGWQITDSTIISYKTTDVRTPGYAMPNALSSVLGPYLQAIARDINQYRPIKMTDVVGDDPSLPRFRAVIYDPADRILHIQLSAAPDEGQAQQLDNFREKAAAMKPPVRVVVLGPPGVSTSITTSGVPTPTYISTTPPLTVSPGFENRQALGNAAPVVAQAMFNVFNRFYVSGIQEKDADQAVKDAQEHVKQVQATNPNLGASIWVTWIQPYIPMFSVNQPGPSFGGVQVVPEREPSGPPVTVVTTGSVSQQRIGVPPAEIRPEAEPSPEETNARIAATSSMADRIQRLSDSLGSEDWLQRAWHDRVGTVDTSPLDQAKSDLWAARQAAAEGRYKDAEVAIYDARNQLRAAQSGLDVYQGRPPRP